MSVKRVSCRIVPEAPGAEAGLLGASAIHRAQMRSSARIHSGVILPHRQVVRFNERVNTLPGVGCVA
jgi:hypothetical protein